MINRRVATMIAAALACLASGAARAEEPVRARAGRGPSAAEFADLKKRVDAQSDLILQLTRIESEHYQFLLKLLQNGRPGSAPVALPNRDLPPTPLPPLPGPPPPGPERDESSPHPKVATITGHVDVTGKPWGPVYVYVENIREAAVERSVEIKQKDRAFVPNFLAVQKGTRVSFPNADPFFHNVFSPSPTSPFDLGSYHPGEKPGVVRFFNSGVVEVL